MGGTVGGRINEWNPWMHAGDNYPHLTICCSTKLPPGIAGYTDYRTTIWLAPHLDAWGRRFHLTHELVHVERGPVPKHLTAAEERIVDSIAARRCIPFTKLRQAMSETDDCAIAAERLFVPPHGLKVRLRTLTVTERETLREDRRHAWTA